MFPKESDLKTVNLQSTVAEDEVLKQVVVLLMVVNQNELRAVIGLMKPLQIPGTAVEIIQVTRNGVTFHIGKYGVYVSALVQTSPGGMGFDAAEQKTIRAIDIVKPTAVISVGLAFGRDEKTQKFGDVLVCEIVNDYTYQRKGGERIIIRSPQPPVGARLLDIFKNPLGWRLERAPQDVCKVIKAPLISGPHLIDNVHDKEELFEFFPDAKGGEMESGAILSAIHGIAGDHKPEGIIIKAICDWADGKKNKEWQPFAAHAAASYVLHHLQKPVLNIHPDPHIPGEI